MNTAKALTLDDMVKAIIETMPKHFAPDEESGGLYKAPDHSAFAGYFLIERKSRPDSADHKIYARLSKIGDSQGWKGGAYGVQRTDRLLADFPDPVTANGKITDYVLGQMLKQLKEAKKKFIQFSPHNSAEHSVRIVVVSDLSTLCGNNSADEAFIGRKMGGYDLESDELGPIDAVILLKHPSYVFDEENSYWVKCLIKAKLSQPDRNNVIQFACVIHDTLAALPDFAAALTNLNHGQFQPLIVGDYS